METPSKVKPALIGGVILGIAGAALTNIPVVNSCCCAWVVGGGALAAYLYIKDSPIPIRKSGGAAVGALAGFLGGIVTSMISTTISLILYGAKPQKIYEKMMEAASQQPTPQGQEMVRTIAKMFSEHFILFMFVGAIFTVVAYTGIAAIGGLIGTAMFEKRKDKMPPPSTPYPYPPSGMPPMSGSSDNPAPPYPPIEPPTGGGNPPQG